MGKWIVRAMALAIAGILLLGLIMPAFAEEISAEETAPSTEGFTPIYTAEDLQAMAQNPSGNYVLKNDIDMTGVDWKPVDFTGIFDGEGHALLNLELKQLGDKTAPSYDGNRKEYEASYAGLFGTLVNAQVRNLKLVGIKGIVEADVPVFVGGIAGYCYDSTITQCQVIGRMELRAYNQIFGLGGIVGYGRGVIDSCKVDAIMICVDTDAQTKDEQFLGGIYSTGFIDVTNCNVKIRGFVSEHGYAHNGGITGMFMQHPLGTGKLGTMTHNYVSGYIKFFEDNRDRRAYCAPFAGEMLVSSYVMHHNMQKFTRDEVRKYDQELRPCMCENPDIREYTTYSRCAKQKYGRTNWECWTCGFQEDYAYTLITHKVTNWEVVEAATEQKEGLSRGNCDDCGLEQTRVDPVVVPEETEPETVPVVAATEPVPAVSEEEQAAVRSKIGFLLIVLGIAVVLLTAIMGYLIYELIKTSKQK